MTSYRYSVRWRWRGPSNSSVLHLTLEAKPVWNERSNKCSLNTRVERMATLQRCSGLLFFSFALTPAMFINEGGCWISADLSTYGPRQNERGSPVTCHVNVCLSDSAFTHRRLSLVLGLWFRQVIALAGERVSVSFPRRKHALHLLKYHSVLSFGFMLEFRFHKLHFLNSVKLFKLHSSPVNVSWFRNVWFRQKHWGRGRLIVTESAYRWQ